MQLTESDVSYVRAVARKLVGEVDADDVAQDALLKAHAKRAQFEGRSQLRTWLYRITTNTAFALLRTRRRARIVLEEADAIDPAASPEKVLGREALEERVCRLVSELEPKYRDVIVLRYANEHTESEVAGALGLSVATVKIRAFRARTRLRELMAA
ncbi:MAG: RNA polymerase sigma factor [Kofleriaceae bacterium]|nr:RNA polymerase sigma factor [Kofleriaceae bacterium]